MNWCRALAVAALLGCGLLAVDSTFSRPAYCGFHLGCDDVIFSSYGRFLDIPLPILGAIGFAAWLGLTFVRSRLSALVAPAAVVAGLFGLVFIVIQFAVLRRVCMPCLFVDACAIALASGQLPRNRHKDQPATRSSPLATVWLGGGILAFLAPLAFTWLRPAPSIPEQVRANWVAGVVTIMEVTDFDCPHCRLAHAAVERLLKNHGAEVHFVRRVAALPSHEHARPAAKAYLAAQAQGKGEAMASALLASPTRAPEQCRRLATELQLNMDQYDRHVSDPAGDAAIDATAAWAKTAGPGLPLVWIQDHFFHGVTAIDALRRAFERAARQKSFTANTAGVHSFVTKRD